MNPETPRVRDVFVAAVKLPPDRWEAFLRQACDGDEELCRQVGELLEAHQQAGSFLDQPLAHLPATQDLDPAGNGVATAAQEGPGTLIGPYTLLERIGEAGMGKVWMAQQREPMHRRVALKIIKAGMDTRQVVARFEAERQALALMDHPNIARVLDGGTTAGGRPYFVMELVKGTPITQYCDEHRLTVRHRLELFLPVCQAIQHAHQKGIIHRDLKPSNVLIAPYDGRPVPKMIDFGAAKAIGQRLTERTLYTGFGAVVGTLEYMSPEQAELNNQDIDTRSDIYALGVLLYELLTGTTPLSRERVTQAAFTEMLRAVREEDPPRPSTRLSDSQETLPAIAAGRHTEPARLTKLVRGELDWIVMKALEKDRSRRYETANGLARDIEHYLNDEPIEARHPTPLDRAARWARRHRSLVWAGAAVLGVVLVASLISAGLIADAYKQEKAQRIAAQKSEARALAGESLATEQRAEAERQRDAADRAVYAAKMQIASRDWIAGDFAAADVVLEAQLPRPGRADVLGWEWYYLFSQCHGERFVLPGRLPYAGHCQFCWSPDGRFLASVDQIGLVNIWDVASGERKASLRGCPIAILCLAWSPDGQHIAASIDQGTVVIWDAGSGANVRSLMGRGLQVHSIAWSPDSRRLAAGEGHITQLEEGEATIRIWDWRARKSLSSLSAPSGPVWSLDWHPDGRQLAAVYGPWFSLHLALWDTASGRETDRWPTGDGHLAFFSPDGSRLAWGSRPVRVTDLKTREVVWSNGAYGPTWSPSGDRLASAAVGGAITIWDAASGAELSSFAAHAGWPPIAWSPRGDLLAAQYPEETVGIWDTAAGRKFLRPGTPGDSSHWSRIAFSPDGGRLLVAGPNESLRIYDAESGAVLLTGPPLPNFLRYPSWSPDGKRFAISAHSERTGWSVLIGDATTGEAVLPPLRCESKPHALAWSPDGGLLAVGGRTGIGATNTRGWVQLFSTGTGRLISASAEVAGAVDALSWSPDGTRLAAAGGFEPLRVWDAGLHPQPFAATTPAESCLDWSPDGKRLVSGTRDGNITIYDAASGAPLYDARAHGYVEAVSWHPRMPRIASGGRDGMIRIWDSSTGQELCVLQTQSSLVRDLDWSPDGWRLASTGSDGSVRIWDASPAVRFLERHGDLRSRVWKLIPVYLYWGIQGATDAQFQAALGLLKQLRALHPEEKELQRQALCVEWLHAVQLARDGKTTEAIALFRRLTAEAPDLPDYRLQLPYALFVAKKEVQAIALLEAWVAEFPRRSDYHQELAFLYESRAIQLGQSGQLPEAVAILRKLAQEFPERPGHCSQVMRALMAQLPPEQVIAVFRRLAREFPDAPEYRDEARVQVNLGLRLSRLGRYAEAVAQYREALRLRPDDPEAHAKLGIALACQGKDAEAEAEYRQAPGLRPGAREAFINPSFALRTQQKFAAAARLLAAGLAAEPELAEDLREKLRYNAACAAVLAGCGRGSGAAELSDAERARLRRQALDWLRADLAAWSQLLEKQPDQARSLVQERIQFWQGDTDFVAVRGDELARLPEAERRAWQQLWKDVELMLKRVSH
jgi:WD40 repeat protein/serine/threonine protein kinase/tetratricopeptide (TPR) repeat protein